MDVLYLVKVYNDGILIGYRPYRWTPTEGYVRVFNTNTPNLKAEDGGRETPVKVVNPPRPAFEKVFNGHVGFNKEPYIQGKPLHQWIDQEGGVTQEELEAALDSVNIKVVTLSNVSGTLSDTDYQLALSNRCLLLSAPVYLYKDRDASTILVYQSGPFVTNGKTYILRCEIVKATKGFTLTQELISDNEIAYSTEVPTAANTSGKLKVVVLDSDPATKYDGYLYLIEEE